MDLLCVESLSKQYTGFALKKISFSLPAGYICGYVGKNGAGKTTTLNLITGLSCLTSGKVTIDGLSFKENAQEYLEKIGYIGDESYFPKEFKISDVEKTLKTFYKSFSVEKFRAYLQKWNLPRNKKIIEFSKGMKVKLMFAGILSRNTRLMILDEATNGLDPVMRREIMEILQKYVEDGEHSILFSTHMLYDLEQIADYIVFIDEGEQVLNQTKDDMLESYLVVKGDEKDLTPELRKHLIGMEMRSVAFSALIETDQAVHFGKNFVLEKPDIDGIVFYQIAERTKHH